MATPDHRNNHSIGKSVISTSKINNKTDFQWKKRRALSDSHKEKLSKPKAVKVPTFLPESQHFKTPFIIKQVAKDENCLFCSLFAAQGLMTRAI
jgi:hypothetical protein